MGPGGRQQRTSRAGGTQAHPGPAQPTPDRRQNKPSTTANHWAGSPSRWPLTRFRPPPPLPHSSRAEQTDEATAPHSTNNVRRRGWRIPNPTTHRRPHRLCVGAGHTKELGVHFVARRKVLHVLQQDRRLHHVLGAAPRRLQDPTQIVEGLMAHVHASTCNPRRKLVLRKWTAAGSKLGTLGSSGRTFVYGHCTSKGNLEWLGRAIAHQPTACRLPRGLQLAPDS